MSDTSPSPKRSNTSNGIEQLLPFSFFGLIRQERFFLMLIGALFIVAGSTFQIPHIAMWIGFLFAGYSAIANDSIQTIGTFLASNSKRPWWLLWLFIGGIFLVTVTYSWITYNGDVSYQRLASKGFSEAPTEFTFLQIAAPLFLLIITRLKMPVSTTFLILSCFSSSLAGITGVLQKSMLGYGLAFVAAIIVWFLVARISTWLFKGEPHPAWIPVQWVTSGTLWSVWIMQDAANIAVYLPRSLSIYEFAGFAGFIFAGLGVLFYLRGDRIQEIVTEKSFVTDVRSATIIDAVYAIILYYLKIKSNVPMSTTWVFIGLLGGREVAMSLFNRDEHGRTISGAFKIIGKDVGNALIGLAISITLALLINPGILEEIKAMFM